MKIEGAKHLFYELLDQWTDDYKVELRLKVTEAFANVANGGAINQNLGALDMLDLMERSEKTSRKDEWAYELYWQVTRTLWAIRDLIPFKVIWLIYEYFPSIPRPFFR